MEYTEATSLRLSIMDARVRAGLGDGVIDRDQLATIADAAAGDARVALSNFGRPLGRPIETTRPRYGRDRGRFDSGSACRTTREGRGDAEATPVHAIRNG